MALPPERRRAGDQSPPVQFENIWLRTKRYNAQGKVASGTGGVCYLYFPVHITPAQKRVLAGFGIR